MVSWALVEWLFQKKWRYSVISEKPEQLFYYYTENIFAIFIQFYVLTVFNCVRVCTYFKRFFLLIHLKDLSCIVKIKCFSTETIF